jgi:hypothetical protein
MRALQATENNWVYFLPYEGSDDEGDGRNEISAGEFQLRGLLKEVKRERESLEQHDPLRRISYQFDQPGQRFQLATDSSPDATGLELVRSNGEVLSETRLWNDDIGDERRGTYERHTEGTRTTVPLDAMLGFLQSESLDLIVTIEIDRKLEDERPRRYDQYEPPPTRVYLIRGDGSIETAA